ncbi:MAG: RNA-binding protein [Zoogloea sp.]|nr:RNA-binding protein [Zoogloea sp.]
MNSFHRRNSRPAPRPVADEPRAVDRHGLTRVDSLLVERGLAPSRAAARRMIAEGRVQVDGAAIAKASHELPAGAVLSIGDGSAAPVFPVKTKTDRPGARSSRPANRHHQD